MLQIIQNLLGGIVDFFASIFNFLFGGIATVILEYIAGSMNITIPENVFDVLNEITIGVGYILPVRELLPIPLFMLSFYSVKLVFSIYQLIAGTIIQRVRLR